MTDYTDLKARLRDGRVTQEYDNFVVIDPPTQDTREAAAAITALEAILDHWRKEWDKAHYAQQEIISVQETRITALEAEVARLREELADEDDFRALRAAL